MKYFVITYLVPIIAMALVAIYSSWYTNSEIQKTIMQTCINNGAMNVNGVGFNCEPQRR